MIISFEVGMRNKPSHTINNLHQSLLQLQEFVENNPEEDYLIEEEMYQTHLVLNKTLKNDVYRLYGRRTVANDNYWSTDYSEFQRALGLIDSYGGLPALQNLTKQIGVLVGVVEKKEKEYADQETIERKTFTYNKYKVIANDLSEVVIEALLEPIDIFEHIFKRRGVEVLLHEALDKIYLCPDQDDEIGGGWGKASARYLEGKETIILYDNILDATCDISEIKGIVYGFIHEVGHWLHWDFLTPEAYDYWNKSWEGVIPEGMTYLDYESAKDNETLKELGIPTPYGHRDPYEDFAETFAFFILKPSRLSERALERMKETLRMSMRGGRTFMRLASRP